MAAVFPEEGKKKLNGASLISRYVLILIFYFKPELMHISVFICSRFPSPTPVCRVLCVWWCVSSMWVQISPGTVSLWRWSTTAQALHRGPQSARRRASVTSPSTQSSLIPVPFSYIFSLQHIHTHKHRDTVIKELWVCLFFRGRKVPVVSGGQLVLCVVCHRGASQLPTPATNTGVRVHSHIYLCINHI